MDSVDKRLNALEQRLTTIEKRLNIGQAKAAATPAWVAAPTAPRKPGNWLGIIAIICFIVAAGFIVKLSIQNGWLTPDRQICLAALLGFSLIGAGLALLKTDRAYASLLPGAGIVILYLTTFAAYRHYHVLGFEQALWMTAAVSGFCMWLYTRIRHDIYAITAAVGAYAAPGLLGMQDGAAFAMYYFLICSVAFSSISVLLESRTLTMVSAYLAILMTHFTHLWGDQPRFVAEVLLAQFLIFSVATYVFTIRNKRTLTSYEAWSFMPVLVLFYAMEYALLTRIDPASAPWISLGFAGFLLALYLSARKIFPQGLSSQGLILAFATFVCFHSVYWELLPPDVRPWLFVVFMIGAALLSVPLTLREGPYMIPAIAVLLILGAEFLNMVQHLVHGDAGLWPAMGFAALASIWIVLSFARERIGQQASCNQLLLAAAHLMAVVALWRLTQDISSLAVSASWLCYAVCVIAIAYARRDETMAKSALFVLAFAAAKALLFDAAEQATVIRIFCLLLTGVVLYACGLFMRRIGQWSKEK